MQIKMDQHPQLVLGWSGGVQRHHGSAWFKHPQLFLQRLLDVCHVP
jgi:hypothetical protein